MGPPCTRTHVQYYRRRQHIFRHQKRGFSPRTGDAPAPSIPWDTAARIPFPPISAASAGCFVCATPPPRSIRGAPPPSPRKGQRARKASEMAGERAWLRAAVFLRVRRWTDWALLAALYALLCAWLRARAAPLVLGKWAGAAQRRGDEQLAGLALGLLEDLCVSALLLGVLCAFDKLSTAPASGRALNVGAAAAAAGEGPMAAAQRMIRSVALATSELTRFAVYSLAFLLAALPLAIDNVLVLTRQVRFSPSLAALLVRERDAAGEFQVDDDEWRLAAFTLLPTLALSIVVGLLGASWVNLAEWDPALALHQAWKDGAGCLALKRRSSASITTRQYERLQGLDQEYDEDEDSEEDAATVSMPRSSSSSITRTVRRKRSRSDVSPWHTLSPRALLAITLLGFFASTLLISRFSSSVVALIAWNPTLAEPTRIFFGVNYVVMHHQRRRRNRPVTELLDRETEMAEVFDRDSLFRRTLGYDGPLAFDVKIEAGEQPNILILVIESFRQRDSRYLLQEQAELLLPPNVTLTPNFDKWAKRGIAFRNMWSTWRTSRSIETILFGQVPYDSMSETGTTGGRIDTELSGLPQLFKAKGYQTLFTTGTRADYDDWDSFLPAHGFDELLDMHGLAEIAEVEMKLDPYSRGNHFMTYWGIHDDLSLGVLSYILRDKRRRDAELQDQDKDEQQAQETDLDQSLDQVNGTSSNNTDAIVAPPSWAAKYKHRNLNPWFATHYTISSHVPFEERPDWYFRFLHSSKAPNFSSFYVGHEHAELMKNYAEMRYFSDLVFGSFMDELKNSGVLDDTIVLVVGDHGQAPERGSSTPERDQVSTTRVAAALVAEGRLGSYEGTVISEATSQSDILNTIADIVGVPDAGFVQSGIGRSLKRKPATTRPVYCNNPAGNNAVIIGQYRAQYFSSVSDAVEVFDVEQDPHQDHDLLDERDMKAQRLPKEQKQSLMDMCDDGRVLSNYFRQRWDGSCILSASC